MIPVSSIYHNAWACWIFWWPAMRRVIDYHPTRAEAVSAKRRWTYESET